MEYVARFQQFFEKVSGWWLRDHGYKVPRMGAKSGVLSSDGVGDRIEIETPMLVCQASCSLAFVATMTLNMLDQDRRKQLKHQRKTITAASCKNSVEPLWKY